MTSSGARSSIGISAAVGKREIEGRDRGGDVKRQAAVARGQRLQIGADLVADVAIGGDAVGADDRHVDLAALHQMAAGIVHDQGVGNLLLAKFEGCQGCALVARPGFVDEDMDGNSGGLRLVDRRGRRAPVDGGEPAGVAMGEDAHRRAAALFGKSADQGEAVFADRLVAGDIFFGEMPGEGEARRRGADLPAWAGESRSSAPRPRRD